MDRILEAYLKDFRDQFGLASLDESRAFERFVNHCVISKHHPDAFDPEDVTPGGSGDLGLDGIGIIVNDHLVFDINAVEYLKRGLRRLDVQFIFVQSKMSPHFDGAEIGNFINGVRQFFNHELPVTTSARVCELHKVKEHIFDSSIHMDRNPTCRLYYATTGLWKGEAPLRAIINQGDKDLTQTALFHAVEFGPIDAEGIKKAYREVHNKIVREIAFDKHTILPTISGVKEAYIGTVPCVEYLRLLCDDDGVLNRRLFYDNVRDFQGHNPVNSEIHETIVDSNSNDRFALLNNGVTIVARDVNKVGVKFKLMDYQIVNGCQTSHILYNNRHHLTDKVYLPIKLIVTDDNEVINQVIQGTNRQTEVKLEAFESLAPFQKKLEELYLALARGKEKPLYYERRSKQYDHLSVGRDRIVTLPSQIKCFVAMFLNEPHSTHRYYGELLRSYRSRLFSESHLPITYYVAAAAFAKVEQLFSASRLPRQQKAVRYQLLMVFRLQNGVGELPPLNSNRIERYCDNLIALLNDDTKSEEAFLAASKLVEGTEEQMQPWREPPERTRAFTSALITSAGGKRERPGAVTMIPATVKWFSDVRGYGFVELADGRDVFLHQSVLVESGGQSVLTGQQLQVTTVRTPRGLQVAAVGFEREEDG